MRKLQQSKKIITVIPSAFSHRAMGDLIPYIDYYKNEFKIVVVCKKYLEEEVNENEIYFVRAGTLTADNYIFISEYIIDAGSLNIKQRISEKQKWISVWHGIPYKKMFIDLDPREVESTLNYSSAYDLMISPSKKYSQEFLRNSMLYEGEILEVGSARTDNLFLDEKNKQRVRNEFRVPEGKKIVVYAPTYRERGIVNKLPFDPDKLLKTLGDDFVLVVKLHYLNELAIDNKNVIDGTRYANVNNLLAITDLLITDYSSLFFDYSVLSDKTVFYQYDYDEYAQERGFMFDLEDYVPAKYICKTEEELYKSIKQYNKITNKIKNNFYPHADGSDTLRIVEKLDFEPEEKNFEDVIFLVNELNNIGGIVSYIKLMAKGFKEKYNSRIIVMGIKEFLHSSDKVEYFNDVHIDIRISSEKYPGACKTILRKTNGLVITTQFSSQLHFQKHLYNKNVVLMFHGDIQQVIDKDEYNWQMDFLNEGKIYNYKKLALLTESNVDKFKNHFIYPELLTSKYNPFEFNYNNLYKQSGVFVTVTRLEEDKNVFAYIELFDNVNLNPDFKLEIYGDGSLKKEMQKEIDKRNLSDRIKLMGYCDDKDIMYGQKQGFIFTPKSEGYGYVILEAYSYGLPVYCFDSFTAINEVINEYTGVIIENNNYDEFAKQINNGFTKTKLFKEKVEEIAKKSEIDNVVNSWTEEYYEISKMNSTKKLAIKKDLKTRVYENLIKKYYSYDVKDQIKVREVYQHYIQQKRYYQSKKEVDKLPLISIVMPFYNNESTIERAIKSIMRQKYKNVEVIIVDDGSYSFDKKLLEKYKNVKLYETENAGPGPARNFGITKATGEYLLFLDSDDELATGALTILVNYALENNLDIVTGKKLRVQAENLHERHVWMWEIYQKSYVNKFSRRHELLKETTSTGILYNRQSLIDSGIKFKSGMYEDKLFMANILAYYEEIGIVKDFIYYWYVYGENTSITTTLDIENFRHRYKSIEAYFTSKSDVFKFHYLVLVITHDFKIYINSYCTFDDHEKREIFEKYCKIIKENYQYYYERNIVLTINKVLVKYAYRNDFKKFDKVAEMYSQNLLEKDDSANNTEKISEV